MKQLFIIVLLVFSTLIIKSQDFIECGKPDKTDAEMVFSIIINNEKIIIQLY